jgi:hypothetical protein
MPSLGGNKVPACPCKPGQKKPADKNQRGANLLFMKNQKKGNRS